MNITDRAMSRIRRLRRDAGVSGRGVRVSVLGERVALEWSPDGPDMRDLIVRPGPPAVFMDADCFMAVADLQLDAEGRGETGRFLLRRRPPRGREGLR